MSNTPNRYLVTAALPYANGPAHLGHIAGAYLPADIYVRYLRLMGEDVLFVCGSDENGAAITIQAKREGKTPQEIVNKYHAVLKNGFANLGIEFDIYHRTSSALHHQTASDFFKILYEKGVFTEITSEQYYDEQFNQFLADRYIQGTCPKCGSDRAYGDQCENCGSALSPTDLINPISILSKQPPVLKTTKHWYLRMDELQADIKNWLQNTQENEPWKNHVIGQCNAWFNEGLQPRAMTRDLDWGVPVPLPDAQGKVLYVWLDAPIGYISATKQWAIDKGNPELWREYWQNPDTKLIHFIGKDNIVFHCINFPMILKAHGNYVLPTNVPANQFLNLEGQKFSTSRNHAVWVHEYLADFPEHQDALRYVLAANMPENKDSDFSWRDFQARNNNELLAVFGNFVNRVSVLMQKNYAGSVPAVPAHILEATNIEFANVFDTLQAFPYEYDAAIHNFEFRNGLTELMNVARLGNKLISDTEPWKLIKTNPDKTAAILRLCLRITAYLAAYCQPYLPFTAIKLRQFLQLTPADIQNIIKGNYTIETGQHVEPVGLLFQKITEEQINQQLEKLQAAKQQNPDKTPESKPDIVYLPQKETISYDEFAKMDIRVGTILAAEKVQKADKLLKLQIDLGYEQRTVVSGIAEHYQPNEIINQKVLVLANLAPRLLRGIESRGMILMAADPATGKLLFVAPPNDSSNGATVA